MKYCNGYIGSACSDGRCPNTIEDEDGNWHFIKCSDCWYYNGCDDCAAPDYGCCPEEKVENKQNK